MHLLSWKNSDPASVVLYVLLSNDESACGICLQQGSLDFCFVLFISLRNKIENWKTLLIFERNNLWVFENLLINSGGFQISLLKRTMVLQNKS